VGFVGAVPYVYPEPGAQLDAPLLPRNYSFGGSLGSVVTKRKVAILVLAYGETSLQLGYIDNDTFFPR